MRFGILLATFVLFTLESYLALAAGSARTAMIKNYAAQPLASATETAAASCAHPLDPLNRREIERALNLVKAHPNTPAGAFFPNVVLNEPPKAEVLAYQAGNAYRREALIEVYDRPKNELYKSLVDLRSEKVISYEKLTKGTQPAAFFDEFDTVLPVVTRDPEWQAAIKKRGIKVDDVYLDIWSSGGLALTVDRDGNPVPEGTRITRVLSFFRGDKPHPYDRPIEGLVAIVDMNRMKVLQVSDTGATPVSAYNGKSTDIEHEPLQALQIVQETPNYKICGQEVSWQGWRFRFAMLPREGLVLYTLQHENKGILRPVAYRIGMSELYVPYGVPDSNWVWRMAFDLGEYGLGRTANPLSPKSDVPNNAAFFNARLADDTGGSFVYPNSIALYERNGGLLWKRVDPSTFVQNRRESRELVLTANSWIGNYIYGVQYIFRASGELEVRADATGTTLNQGVNSLEEGSQFGRIVDIAKAVDGSTAMVAAPNHQHYFNFRVDLDVDGTSNRITESNVGPKESALGNAFTAEETLLSTEDQAKRQINIPKARSWKVYSSDVNNGLGVPTGYTVELGDVAVPYASSTFPARQRAGFAEYPVWVTQYNANELYATGEYPNQRLTTDGLPVYSGNDSLVDTDLVLWVTAGLTHIPDIEQYPVMNTESLLAFRLLPYGFFRRNPALN